LFVAARGTFVVRASPAVQRRFSRDHPPAAREEATAMRNWKKKLQNPFALVGQGFVVGVLLFWATAPRDTYAAAPDGSAAVSTDSSAVA
jgi:hypothetical protein